MSDISITQEQVVIIKTWDKEEFIIKMTLYDWNNLITDLKERGENKVHLKDYDYNLYFANIKSEKGKKKYIALPPPKEDSLSFMGSEEKKELLKNNPKKYHELEQKDLKRRENIQNHTKRISGTIKQNIQKKFIEKRTEILKRLAVDENKHGFETTISKLERLEKYIKAEQIRKLTQ